MTSVFARYKHQDFYEISKAYFEMHGYTMVQSAPADIMIMDLDSLPDYPDVGGSRLVIFISVSDRLYWGEKLPPHDMYWLKPIDIWYRLDLIIKIWEHIIKPKSLI